MGTTTDEQVISALYKLSGLLMRIAEACGVDPEAAVEINRECEFELRDRERQERQELDLLGTWDPDLRGRLALRARHAETLGA